MNPKLAIAAISLCLFGFIPVAVGATNLTMTIGESRDLTLPTLDVKVSRKGVVDLFHRGGTAWTVTALKRGFVLITSGSEHWKISVLDHQAKSSAGDAPSMCDHPHVTCRKAGVRVNGEFQDARQFFAASRFCTSAATCEFGAKLACRRA